MSDDLMRQLAAARPDHLDPAVRPDAVTRSTELATTMAVARESAGPAGSPGTRHGGARRGVRPTWGLGVVGATAAAALAVTTFVSGIGGPGGTGTGGTGAGPTTTTGTGARPRNLPARTVLLAAAHEADSGPTAVGRYWRVTSTSRNLFRTGSGANIYTVSSRQRGEQWTAFDPKDVTWSTDRYLGAAPWSEADRAAWRRAGSPRTITLGVPKPGGPTKEHERPALKTLPTEPLAPYVNLRGPGKATVTWRGRSIRLTELRMRLSTRDAEGRIGVSDPPGGDEIFWLGRNVSMKDLRSLPSDPTDLKARLIKWYGGHGTEADSQKASPDEWLFDVVRGLILDMPVTPQVRAAAFRMLAGLAGVRVIDGVKTESGRVGAAVAIDRTDASGVREERILFDRGTGLGLGDAAVLVKPKGVAAGIAPGTVWRSREIQAGWTDTEPNLLK